MLELLFEYTLCVVDSTILLFFYHVLNNAFWEWKKALSAIFIMALFQIIKDSFMNLDALSSFIDSTVVVLYLYIYMFRFTFFYLVSAMLISSIMKLSIMIFVGMSIVSSINISATLVFGWERIVFCIFLKLFIIFVFFITISQFSKLQSLLTEKVIGVMFFILTLVLFFISYIYGNTKKDNDFLFIIIFIFFILISILKLVYHYCILVKENERLVSIKHSVKLTSQFTQNLEHEHRQIKKIQHDMKNQLLILLDLQESNRYNEVKSILSELTENLDKYNNSFSTNIYVDSILRQKQSQYKNFIFNLTIALDKDFYMDGTDIISLLSNVIDNACEELNRIGANSFQLKLKGNKTMLQILEVNPCREYINFKTDKSIDSHGYGLEIIREIVKKYEGDLSIEIKDEFRIFILLNL